MSSLNQNWKQLAPFYFRYADKNYSTEVKDRISEAVLKFYFSNQEPPVTEATFQNITNIVTDTTCAYGVRKTALMHARHQVPTYAGILSIDGIYSGIFNLGFKEVLGKSSCDTSLFLSELTFTQH